MFGSLKTMALRKGAASYLQPYGELLKLDADWTKRNITIVVALKGETSPITVDIKKFNVVERDGRVFIEIDDVSVSREWANTLAQNLKPFKPIRVPQAFSSIVKNFL
jgi:hypothetical protein